MSFEIARQRFEICRQLLTQTTHKILSIAAMAGFGDVKCMGKTFKRRLGMTPQEYRQSYQRTFAPSGITTNSSTLPK